MNQENRTKIKNFEELKFSDNFMFGKVMEDEILCRDVIECLLQRPVGELKKNQTEKEIRFTPDGKQIRLDVFNLDEQGTVYDAEMENLNHRRVEDHHLPRRSRFYQSAIDIDLMNQGMTFKELPESHVIFICTFDPFKAGRAIYTFKERCDEDDMFLNDGTVKHFFNCTYMGADIPNEISKLYDYIRNGKTESDLTKRIETAVKRGRLNSVWRAEYMKELALLQDAKDEGIEEGIEIGTEKGIKIGTERAEESYGKLILRLTDEGRTEDLIRAAQDKEYRKALMDELFQNSALM